MGDGLPKRSEELLAKLTAPKPLLNDASLLSAMETCGKEIEDETIREALKECGIGTPATRANIIETLLFRGYIERQKKLLVPTPKGLAVHDLLKTKLIASPEMTGQWEKRLNHIAMGVGEAGRFMEDIRAYTQEITKEILGFSKELESVDLGTSTLPKLSCPKCKEGTIKKGVKNFWCSAYKDGCDFKIWLSVGDKKLTDKQVFDLVLQKKTCVIKGFRNKDGELFDAPLLLDGHFKVRYAYPKNKHRSRP